MQIRKIARKEWKSIVAILIVLIVASYFRLSYMDLIEFKSEEARDTVVIQNIVEGKGYPLLGAPFSAGGRSGPVFYYLLSIPYFIVRDPRAVSFFVGILNVFGVFLMYKIGNDFFSRTTGIISAAFLAVAPYAVMYSRKIWNIDVLLPFVLLFFYLLLSYFKKKESKYLILAAIPLAFCLQIHITSVILVFILIFSLIIHKQKIRPRELLAFMVIFLVIFSPFFYYEVNHNYENIRTFFNYKSKIASKQLNSIVWHHFTGTTTGLYFDFILGSSSQRFYAMLPSFTNQIFALQFLLILLSLVYISKKIIQKSKKRKEYLVLIFWIVITLVLLSFFSGGLYPHHLTIILPAVYLSTAILLSSLISCPRKIVKAFALLVLFLIIAMQVVFLQMLFNFLNINCGAAPDYDIAYKCKLEAVNFVIQDSGANSFEASNYLTRHFLNQEYTYLFSQSGKLPSSQSQTEYIIQNTFTTQFNSAEKDYLSNSKSFEFGPIKVYKIALQNVV
jgi:4-amino-4-deoxy-L-arabinose transferase-like glycosyltransferase